MGPGEAIVAIAGMLTGLLATGAIVWGVVQFARARHHGSLPDSELQQELAALHQRVDQLQQQLYETQERLEFTERLLTQGRDAPEAH